MAKVCSCDVVLGNTGLPSCVPIPDVSKRLIFVPLFATDGTRNEYAASTTFNEAFFTARVNDTDASKRWYPTGDIENIEDSRADAIIETFNSGKKAFIQQGSRTFKGVIVNGMPELLDKLDNNGCSRFGALVVDKVGNLICNGNSKEGYIRPIEIDKDSWYPRYVKPTDQNTGKIELNFDWAITEDDANLRILSADDLVSYDIFDLEGLVDLYPQDATNITNTTFKTVIKTSYGSVKNPVLGEGFIAADFSLRDSTTLVAKTITSVTEAPDGTYAFVFPYAVDGIELELRMDKDGFEMQSLLVDIES